MLQHAGFENRHVDAFNGETAPASDSTGKKLFYAPVFGADKMDSLEAYTAFPGKKQMSIAQDTPANISYSSFYIELPILFVIALAAVVFLKSRLRGSFLSIMAMGVYQKFLPEAERRQIDRSQWIIGLFDWTSCFLFTIIAYGFVVRTTDLSSLSFFGLTGLSVNRFILFLIISVGVFGFFSLKNLFLSFLGSVFAIPKRMREYLKTFRVFSASVVPVSLIAAAVILFAPLKFITAAFILIAAYLLIMFIARLTVGFRKVFDTFGFRNIHIFLYLCTLEILPFFIIGRFLYVSVI